MKSKSVKAKHASTKPSTQSISKAYKKATIKSKANGPSSMQASRASTTVAASHATSSSQGRSRYATTVEDSEDDNDKVQHVNKPLDADGDATMEPVDNLDGVSSSDTEIEELESAESELSKCAKTLIFNTLTWRITRTTHEGMDCSNICILQTSNHC